MGEAKFTPGPWGLEAGFESSKPGDFNEYWQVHDGRDAIVCSSSFCMAENKEANAHLIAAAPELYEALQRLVNVSSEIAPEAQAADVITSARAALAKARGETP